MKQRWPLSKAISVSVIGHLLLFSLFQLNFWKNKELINQSKNAEQPKYQYVVLKNKNETPNKEKLLKATRIVRTLKSESSTDADPNSFLGEQNQRVKKQTMSLAEGNGASKLVTNQREKSTSTNSSKAGELARFGIPILNNRIEESKNPHLKEALERESKEQNWVNQGTASPREYVQGIENANYTALNTREFIFFGYFDRIRKSLDLVWSSHLKSELAKYYRKGRVLASNTEHRTRTLVTLNSDGQIVRMRILVESGTQDLDAAAVEAFNKAGPFPNPPKGIIDKEGKIEFQWEFVLRT